LLPRPQRPAGPPILIGGNGIKRTLPLAARYAQEWNAVFLTPEQLRERNERLDALLEEQGRDPREVRRSMMAGCVFGRDPQELDRKVAARTQGKRDAARLREKGLVVGTAEEMIRQLQELEAAGLQRVMLQWLDLDDLDGLQVMAEQVLPEVQGRPV
jgi:alkanesulfonate monooxygenase SsuD/methylene tetrahydromethanopterin reductase-like flavin-dependent oxidoreductase (luciferase family)